MNIFSRYVFLFGLLFLLLPLFFPLWQIQLEAPQYPIPLGLNISIDKIEGIEEHDLENINLLNHYIGMKKIEPQSIPELRFMKNILWGFLLFGLAVFFSKNKPMLAMWMLAISVAGILAIYDFNKWEYDYGHNLDPRAPLKMDDVDYKPPLFGQKQLMNITASSYPALGGIGFLFAAIIGMVATAMAFLRPAHEHVSEKKLAEQRVLCEMKKEHPLQYAACILMLKAKYVFLSLVVFFASCSKEPVPIEYGLDACALCKMSIADSRYGTELITKKGKIYKFDSVECMIDYISDVEQENIHALLVTDFAQPGNFADAKAASYLLSENLPSPMGANLTAFGNDGAEFQNEYGGEILNWSEVVRRIGN